MYSRCICNICICGKHHCKLRSSIFPSGEAKGNITEYTSKYTEHEGDPVKSFKPKYPPMPDGKMDGKTIHNTDFQPHCIEKPRRHIQKPWIKPSGEVANLTSYRKDYTQKDVPLTGLIRQVSRPITSGKFCGDPTYKTDYKQWDLGPKFQHAVKSWQKPTEKMLGESTCMRDYIYREGKPAVCYRQKSPDLTKEPLSNMTNYRDIYIEHPLPTMVKKETSQYKRPEVPIDSLSVTMRDYQGHSANRPQNYGPDKTPYQTTTPFEDRTTFKDDYLEWPTTKPKLHEYPKYKEPESKIDFVTSHNQAYRKLPLVPTETCRPKTVKLFPDVFSGNTVYKSDYKPWEITRGPLRKENTYVANDNPFKGISATKADYVPFPFQKTECFRRDDSLKIGNEPFDDGTLYRNEYIYKEPVVCPVPLLGTKDAPLQFDKILDTGHVLYKPISAA
ncbi:Hypothetical predicted protein [Octopus vulgaris]|uniref:Stabilizer of axonemal microtubules 2 n=1 Tax=Octopus vulgaris TaxID=6645 RepID=A0AA36AXM8_OCTVU|nr:Hypothetical predicted protein [Octopus vulgaris]